MRKGYIGKLVRVKKVKKMADERVDIERVKRDISKLVNHIAFGGERVIVTSRGNPKAALVSMTDYERLQKEEANERLTHWQAWVAESASLADKILARREGETLDTDALWQAAREDLEDRDDQILGNAAGVSWAHLVQEVL